MTKTVDFQYKIPHLVQDEVRAKVSDRAKALHADALVWDMTLPYGPRWMSDELIFRYRNSGCDVVSLTVNDFPARFKDPRSLSALSAAKSGS